MRPLFALAALPLALAAPLINEGNALSEKYIVVMKPTEISSISARAAKTGVFKTITMDHEYSTGPFNGFAATLTADQVKALKQDPTVAYVEKDGILYTQGSFSRREVVTANNTTWGLGRISHKTKGSTTYLYDSSAGKDTCAYIIDTGIYTEHPEFEGRATRVKNFDKVDGTDEDMYGHGTHVAGTIGSKSYGVAKKSKLLAMKVCNQYGQCNVSNVIAAIGLTVTDSKTRGCTNGVVINMSLGATNSEWASIKDSIKAATDAGVFVAVAAGNENSDSQNYLPASSPYVCAAGASDVNDQIADFSNYGKPVAVFAPGVNILSTYNQGPTSTTLMDGTSMASPHLAGLAAYYLGLNGRIEPAALCTKIKSAATKDAISGIKPSSSTNNLLVFNGAS